MKNLWILKAKEHSQKGYSADNPWKSTHNCVYSMVVRASSEKEARKIAATNAELEGEEAWLSSDHSTCKLIPENGESAVIIKDFLNA